MAVALWGLGWAAPAGATTWVGAAGDGLWTSPENWDTHAVPGPTDDVILPDLGYSYNVVYDTTTTVGSLGVEANAYLRLEGGTLTLVAASHIASLGGLELGNATLAGSAVLHVQGALYLAGGVIGTFPADGGGILIEAGGNLELIGAAPMAIRGGKTIDNFGTIRWNGAGDWRSGDGVVINNQPGGVLLIWSEAGALSGDYYVNGPPMTINNAGHLARQNGTGAVTLAAAIQNTGDIWVETGELILGSTTSHASILIADAGARLTLAGSHTFNDNTTLMGPGVFAVPAGSTVDLAGSSRLEDSAVLELAGDLTGAGTLRLLGDTLWSGGVRAGTGVLDVQPGARLELAGGSAKGFRGGWTIGNSGLVLVSDSGDIRFGEGAVLHNRTDGQVLVQADVQFNGSYFPGAASTWQNEGLLLRRATAGVVTINTAVTNSGIIEVDTGTLAFAGPSLANTGAGDIRGTGVIDISTTSFINDAGTRPGSSPGVLTFVDRWAQGAGGTLFIDLAGTIPGSNADNHDQLVANGTATLAGSLQVDLRNGFLPSQGDTFTVVAASSVAGGFANLHLAPLPEGLVWTPVQTADAFALRVDAAIVQHQLAVLRPGGGAGTVTSSPPGIDCGATCEALFDAGTPVTLTATPLPGSAFVGWSGGGCTGTGDCVVPLAADTTVSAEFVLVPSQCPSPVVSGDRSGLSGTTHDQAFDGDTGTYFASSYDDWQYLEVDFGCPVQLNGLRRHMTRDGVDVSGNRGPQGERISYSLDGVTWTDFLGSTTTGWESFTNYVPHAWHSVTYGWSPWLMLATPVTVHKVRFAWDGNADAVNEVEIDAVPPPPISSLFLRGLEADGLGAAAWNADGSGPEPAAVGHAIPPPYNTCGNPNAFYYLASRDYGGIDAGSPGVLRGLLPLAGFPDFLAALAAGNFAVTDLSMRFGLSTLGADVQGEDWTLAGSFESRRYTGGFFTLLLNGEPLVGGPMPDLFLDIEYADPANCGDDAIFGRTAFVFPADLSAGSSPAVQAAAAAFLSDLTATTGIKLFFSGFLPAPATTLFSGAGRGGAFFEVQNGYLELGPLAAADLEVGKVAWNDPVDAGGQLTYEVWATNYGPDLARNVVLLDNPPEPLTGVEYSQDAGATWNPWPGQVQLGDIESGFSRSILLRGTVHAGATDPLVNEASAGSDTADPNPANNNVVLPVQVNASANLFIAKHPWDDPVPAGSQLIYSIDVFNAGPLAAPHVLVSDSVPPALFTPEYSLDNGNTWLHWTGAVDLGTVDPGLSAGLLLRGTVDPGFAGQLANSASVLSDLPDPDLAGNEAFAVVQVAGGADLVIDKWPWGSPVTAGEELTFSIEVYNDGPQNVTQVTVTDQVPAGLLDPVYSLDGGLTWLPWPASDSLPLGGLAADGSSLVFQVRGTVEPGMAGQLVNTALVVAEVVDPNPANNTVHSAVTVNPINACRATWHLQGPSPGLTAGALLCSATDAGAVLAAGPGGIFRTADGGDSWDYRSLRFRGPDVLADGSACGLGYLAANGNEVWQSLDNGATWAYLAAMPAGIEAILVAPGSCTVFVGTQDGVYTSSELFRLPGLEIKRLAASGGVVLAGTDTAGIFRTTDDGQTWTPAGSGLDSGNVQDLLAAGGHLYAAIVGGAGLYASTDAGVSWTAAASGLPETAEFPGERAVTRLAAAPDGTLYAAVATTAYPVAGAVYQSLDQGASWHPAGALPNGRLAHTMCVSTGGVLFAGGGGALARTGDGGAHWTDLSGQFPTVPFDSSPFVQDGAGRLFIGSRGDGIYRSLDEGASWARAGTGGPARVSALLVDGADRLYALSDDTGGVYRSLDHGATWALAAAGLPTKPEVGLPIFQDGEALAKDGSGRLYVGLDNGTVYFSDDSAASWQPAAPLPFVDGPGEIRALAGGPASQVFAAVEREGLFRSDDGGATWVSVHNGLPAFPNVVENSFFRDPLSGDLFVAFWNGGLFRTADAGVTWQALAKPNNCDASSVVRGRDGRLFASACGGSVFVSLDDGASWQEMSDGLLPYDDINGINLSRLFLSRNNQLLAAARSGGIYRAVVSPLVQPYLFTENCPADSPLPCNGWFLRRGVTVDDACGLGGYQVTGDSTPDRADDGFAAPSQQYQGLPAYGDFLPYDGWTGQVAFTVTPPGGASAVHVSHQLDHPVQLPLPTGLAVTGPGLTPTVSFDTQSGMAEGYRLRIWDVTDGGRFMIHATAPQYFLGGMEQPGSVAFPVPANVLRGGRQYLFEAEVLDLDELEGAAAPWEMVENRSVAFLPYDVPLATMLFTDHRPVIPGFASSGWLLLRGLAQPDPDSLVFDQVLVDGVPVPASTFCLPVYLDVAPYDGSWTGQVTVTAISPSGSQVSLPSHNLDKPVQLPLADGLVINDSQPLAPSFSFNTQPGLAESYWLWVFDTTSGTPCWIYGSAQTFLPPATPPAVVSFPVPSGLLAYGHSYQLWAVSVDLDPDDLNVPLQGAVENRSINFLEYTPVPPATGADLGVALADTADPVGPGSLLGYVITVANDGPDPAEAVQLAVTPDPALTGLAYAMNGQPPWSPWPAGGSLDLGILDPGGTRVIVLGGTVAAGTSGTMILTAQVASSTSDPVPGNNAAQEDTLVLPPLFALNVTVNGNGVVQSTEPGIDCGTDCTEDFPAGTDVTLQAQAAAGAIFAGWGGACSGTGDCVVHMDAPQTVSAEFRSGEVYEPVASWGTPGSGQGQLDGPWSLALDRTGRLFVTETGNNRVQVFRTSDGSSQGFWGALHNPQGVAVTPAGEVMVVDTHYAWIERFTPDGTSLGGFGEFGSADGQFADPAGVAIRPDGHFYVADTDNHRIQKFLDDYTHYTSWGSLGTGEGELDAPYDVAVGPDETVYVADTNNHRIQRFDAVGGFLGQWGGSGSANGEFLYPSGIAVDGAGYVYVADSGNSRIQKFTADGLWVASFGTYGTGPGELNGPADVAVDPAGNIYVSDYGNNRIQTFRPANAPSRTLSVAKSGAGAGRVWTDPAGLDCPGACADASVAFPEGSTLTLHAQADPGSTFLGWSGDACTGSGDCVLAMTGHWAVDARFEPAVDPLALLPAEDWQPAIATCDAWSSAALLMNIYTLANSDPGPKGFSVAATSPWLAVAVVDPAGGGQLKGIGLNGRPASATVPGGASWLVVPFLMPPAFDLAAGSHQDTLTVTNHALSQVSATRTVTLAVSDPAPALAVSLYPGFGDLDASGPRGGPFAPDDLAVYQVENTGCQALDLTVANTAAWLRFFKLPPFDPPEGWAGGGQRLFRLEPRERAWLAVQLAPSTRTLAAGLYTDTIELLNVTNGLGSTSRPVQLAVGEFAVSPEAVQVVGVGREGGTFTPGAVSWELANVRPQAMDWTAASDVPWLDLAPAGGSAVAGTPVPVTAILNEGVGLLSHGVHMGSITFTDTDTGTTIFRQVRLDVLPSFGALEVTSPAAGQVLAFRQQAGAVAPAVLEVQLANPGGEAILWSGQHDSAWLLLNPDSGSLPPGGTVTVHLTVDIAALPATDDETTLEFTNNSNGQVIGDSQRLVSLAVAYSLPDTGQDACFAASSTRVACSDPAALAGQDAQYRAPTAVLRKLNARLEEVPDSTPWPGFLFVHDRSQGLLWEVKAASGQGGFQDREAVFSGTAAGSGYLAQMNSRYGQLGLDHWQLPAVAQLRNIVNYGDFGPLPDRFRTATGNGANDFRFFPHTKADAYWTGEAGPAASQRFVYFDDGSDYYGPADSQAYVRAVHVYPPSGGTPPLTGERFHDNGDGTVTDLRTGLVWQKTGMLEGSWSQALAAAEALTLAGQSDWRLPDVKELASLLDYDSLGPKAMDPLFVHPAGARAQALYWSSTTSERTPAEAYFVRFDHDGEYVYAAGKDRTLYVRAVRGVKDR
ncbi:MAG: DUF1566 domain-containing protein [Thermodesulfobacteriota bacterium]